MNRTILLIRPEYPGIFAKTGPVITEPLELEYLAAAASNAGYTSHIHDPIVTKIKIASKIKALNPKIIAITGYYPARQIIFNLTAQIKRLAPDSIIIVGGVDMEMCFKDYFKSRADILVYAGGTQTFEKILKCLPSGDLSCIDGICYKNKDDEFIQNRPTSMNENQLCFPDRKHFNLYKHRYHYLYYGETAIVKGAFGCPYVCSFCYARLLNQGIYAPRKMENILDEVETINVKTIWMVDDIFFADEKRVVEFTEGVRKRGLEKQFIIYSRADFICANEHLMTDLKKSGVINIIVGLEAISTKRLKSYHKGYDADINERCVKILSNSGIDLTALFIVNTSADTKTFAGLLNWIIKNRIQLFTISVYTPLPGTKDYKNLKHKLTTSDPGKWDFMHLVLKPAKISVLVFYTCLWALYAFQVLANPKLIKMLIIKAKGRINAA